MTSGNEKRLRPKYTIRKIVIEGSERCEDEAIMLSTDPDNVDSPFVLMPRKDPAAFVAMITYAQYCEPKLRVEIAEWLTKVAESEPVFGTQGARNWAAGRLRSIIEM